MTSTGMCGLIWTYVVMLYILLHISHRFAPTSHCQAVPGSPAQPAAPPGVQPEPRGCVCVTDAAASLPVTPAATRTPVAAALSG